MNSFSQGIFVFRNGLHGKPDKRKKRSKLPIQPTFFDSDDSSQLWNTEFHRTWETIQSKVDEIQANNNDGHLAELCDFVRKADQSFDDAIADLSERRLLRVAALLTGINKPDHHLYFKLLANTMSKKRIARTVFLPARDCPNVRTAIEILVSCLLSNGRKHNYRDEDFIDLKRSNNEIGSDDSDESANDMETSDCDNDIDDDDEPPLKLRRSQYTLDVLQSWYDSKFANESSDSKPQLAIIMPNFEEFKPSIIKDLILILSNHCQRLPFVLILGVATSSAILLNTLSFNETTRIKLRIFSGQPPNQMLDQMLDSVMLTPKCPFQLSSNVLEYLKSTFIFYDLTAKHFLRSINYCLLDQYSRGNAYSVCTYTFAQAKVNISKLRHEDFELIRQLPSFRPHIESMLANNQPKQVISLFEDDEFMRSHLTELVRQIFVYFMKFYGFIRLLWAFVKDLPNAPLGKRLSDIYIYCHASQKCVTKTEEFEKCWQLLSMLSKVEFKILLDKCRKILEEYDVNYLNEKDSDIDDQVRQETYEAIDHTLETLLNCQKDLEQDQLPSDAATVEAASKCQPQAQLSRTEFYQQFKQQRAKSGQGNAIRKILENLRVNIFEKHLPAQKEAPPLLELFVYSDLDQIRSHLRGTSRTAIHKALTDPHSYLQCDCCAIENRFQLLPTMPDNSIAYGLLLESGQQVNIYDWMNAFNSIVNSQNADNLADDDDDDNNDNANIPSEIQARFTRARAELHFMGFTKISKRKTDHVTRTTW